MGYFGRFDPDFDDDSTGLSKRELIQQEIREEEENKLYTELESLRKENQKMKKFLKKENLYKKYKKKGEK